MKIEKRDIVFFVKSIKLKFGLVGILSCCFVVGSVMCVYVLENKVIGIVFFCIVIIYSFYSIVFYVFWVFEVGKNYFFLFVFWILFLY